MRILIDLQGAQSGSRGRGIGRYSTAIAKAIIRNRGNHDVFILLNGLFHDTIQQIRDDFSPILSADRIAILSAPSPVEGITAENAWRREAAELIREWTINDIAPDVLVVTSLFEGATDNSITSIGRLETSTKVAVILYDLIPFLDPEAYLLNSAATQWYYSKIDALCRADLLLAISESARHEAIDALGSDADRTVTIYSAADERFTAANISREESRAFLERLGIRRSFVMHASAFEPRKNFDGLIRAFSLLPKPIRENHQLVLVVAHGQDSQTVLRRAADEAGLAQDELVVAGYVSDRDLVSLYSLCTLFVFPSFHEGFGLPALEAMCCGAAVIGSNTTSIPEVIGREDALFDPGSDRSIARVMERALSDAAFRGSLKTHALEQSKRFSWDRSAKLALRAIEGMGVRYHPRLCNAYPPILLDKIAAIEANVSASREDFRAVSDSIAENERVPYELEIALNRGAADCRAEIGDAWTNRGRTAMADARCESVGDELLSSYPDVEVIRQDLWLQDERPRILLLKLDHIGDFIITLDAFQLIRDTWPKAHITLVCGPWNKTLAERSGLFDAVFCCEFFAEAGADYDVTDMMERGLAEYRALALGPYELAIDLRYYVDSRALLLHTDARYCAGYVAEGVQLDLALPMGMGVHPDTGMTVHNGARALALAASVAWTFGTPPGKARNRLLNGRAPIRFFKEGITVGIAPGTGNPIKCWRPERFAELARLLHGRGNYRIVLIGADRDRPDTQFIAERLPTPDVVDLAGTVAIADLPPVLAALDLFIGNDTGTTHMAALMGIPTVCVFAGNSQVDCWRPVGAHVVTLRRAVECSPCYLSKILECSWNHQCMDIPPSLVAAEAIALQERFRSSRLVPEPDAACVFSDQKLLTAAEAWAMTLDNDTLDHFIFETDRLGGPGTPQCVAFWKDLVYKPSVPLDAQNKPRSMEYKRQQIALYREITGHDYLAPRDEMTPNVPIDSLFEAPNAYDHSNPTDFAKHCVAMSLLVQELGLPRGARILELGSGWGFTQEFLAACGYSTTGIELNADFVTISNRRLKRLGFGERVIRGSFDSIDQKCLGVFDAVISYESLHHAVDAEGVVKKYGSCLKASSLFALAAEPFNTYYTTWGLRLDPYSIYSMRKFGWFESGWSVEYMAYIFGRCGMEVKFIDAGVNELTRYMIGKLSCKRHPYQLGMWDPAISSGWWTGWDYCSSKGRSNLLLSAPAESTGLRINAVNFSTGTLNVWLRLSGKEEHFLVQPGGAELTIYMKPTPSEEGCEMILEVVSDTFCPAEVGINLDMRDLGIHIESIQWMQ